MFYIEALSLTVILGLFISAFTAYFTSLISKSPNALVDFVKSKVMTTLTFNSTDINFRLVGEWLNDRLKNSKNLQVKDWGGEQHVTIGQGIHRLWYYGPMWVNYKSQKASTSWDPPIESYTLTFLGADQGKVKEFLKDIQKFRKVERNDQVEIFTWRRGGWGYPAFRRPRQLNTVYMPAGQKQYIMDQLKKFIKSEEWYTNRGIPWRVGCLFWGPPGSGKTTLAQALAAHFKRPIYSVNLKGIPNDEALIEALGDVRREGVVLIEDVDAFNIATKRENIDSEKSFEEEQKDAAKLKTNGTPVAIADDDDEEEEEGTPDNKAAAQKSNGITISGLLNAIDGVTATEGRILIMTTNDVSKLDPALIRNGRVDIRLEIGPLGPSDVVDMFKVFFPNLKEDVGALTHVKRFAGRRSHTASWWQNFFIQHEADVLEQMNDA